jgi:Ca2+-binding RTX toxin-like protein
MFFSRKSLRKPRRSRAQARSGNQFSFAPSFEALEDRRLLAVTATFSAASGVLNVYGDSGDNVVEVSRNAAGAILVNGGAVAIVGGAPTVANTSLMNLFGLSGNDTLSLNESNGALPRANLYGGGGNDVMTGGSGADLVFGQSGNDALLGRGGADLLFGGSNNDTMTGGDADDQAFGQSDDDRMIWNLGDDTDLNEGGLGVDTVEVNGGNGAETFTTTANGVRVRFDRVDPAPFAIDIGTSENLVVNANGGNDQFSATGNLAVLIAITVDGGAGDDTLLGSNGVDRLLGGDNNDFIDGQQGNDNIFAGAGDDRIQWDPGDGSDTIEGQAGVDKLLFNGSGGTETMEFSANGARTRFTRNLGSIVMDLNDVEQFDVSALGSTDTLIVGDLTGTDVAVINLLLAGTLGGALGDAQVDNVIVNGTAGEDAIFVSGNASGVTVSGLWPVINILTAEPANDRLTINGLGGDDVIDASALTAAGIALTADGGIDDDVLIGGDGADVLLGGDGDDVLIGGPGFDALDGGGGDNVVIQ